MSETNDTNKGTAFFRGLEHAENPEQFDQQRSDEIPYRKGMLEVDRRSILKMMGGAAVMAGLTASGCRYLPQRKIIPYVQQPENAISGESTAYASSVDLSGFGVGILVQTTDGHPVRVEGHPDHPASLGSLDSKTVSLPVSMFDPDRFRSPYNTGEMTDWTSATTAIRKALAESGNGFGVALLTETVGSPTMKAQIEKFLKAYPQAKWFQYEPINRDNSYEGHKAVFGQDVHLHHDFSKADIIVSIDGNFLQEGPNSVRNTRDITARRLPSGPGGMNRIYAVESVPTTLGVIADHRMRLKASSMVSLLKYIAAKLGVTGTVSSPPVGLDPKKVAAMVSDLQAVGPKGVVVVGDHLPPIAHGLAALINSKLGSQAAQFGPPVLARPTNLNQEFKQLNKAMHAGDVNVLFIVGGNPAYTAPADLDFGEVVKQLKVSFYLTMEKNETVDSVTYALPISHTLEAWGDTISSDGTIGIRQPVIEPIYDTKSDIEFLDILIGPMRSGIDIVRETHFGGASPSMVVASSNAGEAKTVLTSSSEPTTKDAKGNPVTRMQVSPDADAGWRDFLATGMIPAKPREKAFTPTGNVDALPLPKDSGRLELVYLPDPSLYDGRFANNGWLQELPKPMSHLVWDNAVFVSHKTAEELGIGQQKRVAGIVPVVGTADVVTIKVGDRSLDVPVYVNLGQADDVLALYLGHGRTAGGDVAISGDEGHGGGFNANKIRTSTEPWIASNVTLTKTRRGYQLISTQYHNMLDSSRMDADRGLIYETTPALLKAGKPFGKEGPEREWAKEGEGIDATPPTFYNNDEFKFADTNYEWAMTIDLSLCTGCNACVTACQAENNIAVVGKAQAKVHRAMHWIRIDRYFKGDWKDGDQGDKINKDDPPMYFQPVTCMQCENAPCEPVCPVAATVHSHEGLNQMVYNRCVGTRYCSNNCPYKVRRFNFLYYTQKSDEVPILRMLQNPEVTVRSRGVMEKCTYCVQRINKARQSAKVEGRSVKDGEVVTACQQVCPARAIEFGDKRVKTNKISVKRNDPRSYILLEELNTRPRTSYLARVVNPNPTLEGSA